MQRLGNLRLVARLASAYPGRLAGALAALLTAAAATLAIPHGLRSVIDEGFGAARAADIDAHFLALGAVVAVLAAATAVRFYLVSWLGERIVADLRLRVQRHLLALDPAFYEMNAPSEIASRMTADTAIIEQVVSSSFSIALRNLIMGAGGLVYLFWLSPKLTALMLLVIPATIGPIVWLGRRVRRLSATAQDRIADVGSRVAEMLRGIAIVQAFGAERHEEARFHRTVEASFAAARQRIALRSALTGLVILLAFGAITLVLREGALDVVAGRLSGGTIAAFVLASAIVAGAAGALSEVYGDLMRASGAAERLFALLEVRPEVRAPARPVALPQPPQGMLRFEDVSFRYPARPDALALADVSFEARPAEQLALVGPSGAGKSTILQLAHRFFDPAEGRILLDGVDLRDAEPAEIRQRLAFVPQEPTLFAGTARDNLAYGRPDATDEEVWGAAEAAFLGETLRALPMGLDSELGEGGARLSGGQRQRLAIARALLKDAPILLLDEATASLDAESEAHVQEGLRRLRRGRTVLVIAHRLATVREADRILVFEGGRLVDEGDHESLARREGLYRRLARLQFAA